jgi:hypothetical protein
MPPWFPPVFWFCVLVVVPGLGMSALRRTLPRYRLNLPSGTRMDLRTWRPADADTRNYSPPGKRALRIFKVLQALQMLGFVVWGFVFVL